MGSYVMGKSVLKKEVCKRCLVLSRVHWGEQDDKNWRFRHVVVCPNHDDPWKSGETSKTCEQPPEWCGFSVEHVVLEKSDGCAAL